MRVRVAIRNVHILYSKMGIDQMPNFKTVGDVFQGIKLSSETELSETELSKILETELSESEISKIT